MSPRKIDNRCHKRGSRPRNQGNSFNNFNKYIENSNPLRMFQIPFHRLKFETFSEIDLNKISKWNNIDFSKFVIA